MARLAISTMLICMAALAPSTWGQHNRWTNYGMALSVSAYESVCWYEYFKIYPDGERKDGTVQCWGYFQRVKDYFKDDEETAQRYFAHATTEIPKEYGQSCNKYLDDKNMKPCSDESDVLNDPHPKRDFVLKGFAYCLMSTLRKRHGEKAMDIVKNERTHTIKPWRMMALDKDNDFRARHGVEPFKPLKELDDAAQVWADKLAKECKMSHSKGWEPNRRYKGEYTGESLAASSGNDTLTIPYSATGQWYSEILEYPFPKSCDEVGCGKAAGKPDIGHFTQTVWKNTQYVGYGLGYDPKCGNWYFVGRYYPGGNVKGSFKSNVLPAKQY